MIELLRQQLGGLLPWLMPRVWRDEQAQLSRSLCGLAKLKIRLGQFRESEPLLQQALARSIVLHGEQHLEVGYVLLLKGVLVQILGRCAEAMSLFERDHKAGLLRYLGRYDESLQACEEAHECLTRVLGLRHPTLAHCLNNLARLHAVAGRASEAEAIFRQALELREHFLGTEHPNLVYSLNGLAKACLDLGREAGAEALFTRACAIASKRLGVQHILLGYSQHGLAELYRHQGRFEEAEQLLLKVLALREGILGADHPDTAHCSGSLGELLTSSAPAQASSLLERAVTVSSHALGEAHPLIAHYRLLLHRLSDAAQPLGSS